jgi:hypothetical protein
MTRVVHLKLEKATVIIRCAAEAVGISAIESLPAGGVRLVCMSNDGAEKIRRKMKANLIAGDPTRERHRPTRPLW